MSIEALEERLTAVEEEVKQLKQAKEPNKSDDDVPWWKRIIGIHANTPGFDEAVRLGREWREAQTLADDDGAA